MTRPANATWLAHYGRHVAYDVSDQSPFAIIIGQTVTEVCDILNDRGRVIGRALRIGDSMLRVVAGGDQLDVQWEFPISGS